MAETPADSKAIIDTNFSNLNTALAGAVVGAEVSRATTQTITTATDTAVQFTTEDRNTNSLFSSSSNTRLTAPRAGWYHVSLYVDYASSLSGARFAYIRKNGSALMYGFMPGVADTRLTIAGCMYLAANDYVECMVNHTAGSNLNIDSARFAMIGYDLS